MTNSASDATSEFAARARILIFAPHTRVASGRSGIHRVAMRLMSHLPRRVRCDLVKWDDFEGQLRYCDKADMHRYFGGPPPAGLSVNPLAHRVDYRFGDTIAASDHVVVLMPEVFFLTENGNEIHARVISQCLVDGWTTAAIFYDLIPFKGAGYRERDVFARSLAELVRVDVVLPISHYAGRDLRAFWKGSLDRTATALERSGQRVIPVPLADCDREIVRGERPERKRDRIVLLGTVEPRKQQLRVIRAYLKLRIAERAGLRLQIIGGLNPRCEAEFLALIDSQPDITWLRRASDADIDTAFATARFSVFASNEEGFGLPIVESLSRGVPCLTADHGAMREAAAGGGCLLIDVDEEAALEAGMEHLAMDDEVIARLEGEIDNRAWRTWDDYADAVLAAIASYERPAQRARATARSVETELGRRLAKKEDASFFDLDQVRVEIVTADADPAGPSGKETFYVAVLDGEVNPERLPDRAFKKIVGADAWFCRTRSAYEAVVARAASSEAAFGLLSHHCGWRAEPEPLLALVAAHLSALIERRTRWAVAAQRDIVFRTAWSRFKLPPEDPALTLVISAYNGATFIERNIVHTLGLIRPFNGRVRLVVFDNASTDDTPARVAPFAERGELEYVRMPCNTGLLGNLHAISSLVRARHVWAIGVDDIVIPGALERILAVLEEDPARPFIMPNFAVYHRESFAPQESCANLVADSRPVGVGCGPDAATSVRDAASRHDNLLTAFYIIIFRSDLMAAVFNSPFTAPFFGSMMDTIPSTKVIFETFPMFAATWLEQPVVTGNAHNTWRHHRVAWHGILMPIAFEIAREAGIDRDRLRKWAAQHVGLLHEAEELFPNPGVADAFPEEALESSFRVFGTRLLQRG